MTPMSLFLKSAPSRTHSTYNNRTSKTNKCIETVSFNANEIIYILKRHCYDIFDHSNFH
jgi:hypothetical protein